MEISVNEEIVSVNKTKSKSIWKKLITEPFFHFIILGLFIYVSGKYYKEHHDSERYSINLTDNEVNRLAALWEKQYGSIPTETELNALIESHIKEEILYREGLELNLDQEDELIRRRVAQKAEFLQQDLSVIDEPSEDQLISFYEHNKPLYAIPDKLSFTHIYFSPDNGSTRAIQERAYQTLTSLVQNNISRSPESGDKFPFSYDYSNQTKEDLKQVFGTSEFSDSLLSLSIGKWTGPVKSGYGYHLVYINSKTASYYPKFTEIREQVKADFIQWQRENGNKKVYEELKKKYIITLTAVKNENK